MIRAFLSGCLIMLCVYQGICWGVDAWEPDGAIAADAAPALSQQAVEPASGLARPGFDHTIAGEQS